ncbi:MAG: D-alanyl-D-alanine carboxypeptidase family protein, partial [Clostridia bacterium]|nr:D-alanyl-D-alanine carboxypeptidase family protein [Clostridia bacterium]
NTVPNGYSRSAGYGGQYRDPRMDPRVDPRRDPRAAGYGEQRRDPRMDPRNDPRRDPRGAGYGGQYRDPRMDPRTDPRRDPRGAGASFGGQSSTRARAESYVNSRREAEYRAERERRIAYERQMAEARRLRRQMEEEFRRKEKIRLKKERKRARKLFFGRALVCLVIFAILAVFTAAAYTIHFTASPDGVPNKVKYAFGDKGQVVRTADTDSVFKNGFTYVCFNDVADFLDMAVTGNTDGMRFVLYEESSDAGSEGDGNEDSVTFMIDSRTAVINTQTMTLPSESFLYGEEVWVSTDFIAEFIEGLNVTVDDKLISVTRIKDEALSTEKETVYLDVSLKLKESAPIPGSDDGEEGENETITFSPMPEISFATDLSAYEAYMDPEESAEYLILVNTNSPLDGSHVPTDLMGVEATRKDGRETEQLREYAAKALEALHSEMYAAGYTDVSVMSGYRSYAVQDYLHNDYILQEMAKDPSLSWEAARQIVLTYSSAAGTSEHQTGLCVDMHNLASADVSFASQGAYTWLSENAWKFGYILRYPEDKTAKTGISFEPWHWRYVGRSAAWEITSAGLCLEEYLANQ